jgi:hypothetical protein
MPVINCRARTTVRYASTLLAVGGWVVALHEYLEHGYQSGVDPVFIAALSVGIAFTMVAGQWWMLPTRPEREEQSSVYAIGFRAGVEFASRQTVDPEPGARAPRHLSALP